jgi:4-amino-4-deoxy-L-arabinose transferase-like glycosyltransferase
MRFLSANQRKIPDLFFPSGLFLLTAIILAVFFRFYRLPSLPPYFSYDEAAHALDALDILNGKYILYSERLRQNPAGYMYFLAAFFRLFGASPLTQRSLSALFGVLLVPVNFLAMREIFRRELVEQKASLAAALSSLLISCSFWAVITSRIGYEYIVPPVCALLGLWFFWRGYAAERYGLLALGSLGMAAGFYFYPGGAPAVLIVPIALLAQQLLQRRLPPAERAGIKWKPFLFFVGLSLLLFAPLFIAFTGGASPEAEYGWRQTAFFREGDWAGMWTRLQTSLREYGSSFLGISGDRDWLSNISGEPNLPPVLALCFAGGVLLSLWRINKLPYMVLITYWLGMVIPAVLTYKDTVKNFRHAGAIPPTYMFISLALVEVYFILRDRLNHHLRSEWKKAAGLIAALPLILLCGLWLPWQTFNGYFNIWANTPRVAAKHDSKAFELMERMQQEKDPEAVFLLLRKSVSEPRNYTLEFLYKGSTPLKYIPVEQAGIYHTLTRELAGYRSVHLITKLSAGREGDQKDADMDGVVPRLLEENGQYLGKEETNAYTMLNYRLAGSQTNFAEDFPKSVPPDYISTSLPILEQLEIQGYRQQRENNALQLGLAWRRTGQRPPDYTVFVQFLDEAGERIGGVDAMPARGFSRLERGELMLTHYTLPIPRSKPASILIGLYVINDGQIELAWSSALPY